MREIKFRGKRRDNQQWIYGLPRHNSAEQIGYICGWMGDNGGETYQEHEVVPESVGQFTGLLDKNKKEIYEGDILRIHSPENDDGMGENYEYVTVEFKNGGFVVEYDFGEFDMTTIGWAIDMWEANSTTCEIIGNVYENIDILNSIK